MIHFLHHAFLRLHQLAFLLLDWLIILLREKESSISIGRLRLQLFAATDSRHGCTLKSAAGLLFLLLVDFSRLKLDGAPRLPFDFLVFSLEPQIS
jgi:hypothetical protein